MFVLILALTLLARAPDPRSRAPQPPVVPSTRESPPPASSCLAGGGVAIGAGDDAQWVVNAAPRRHHLHRQGRHPPAELQRPAQVGRHVLRGAGRGAGRRTEPGVGVLRRRQRRDPGLDHCPGTTTAAGRARPSSRSRTPAVGWSATCRPCTTRWAGLLVADGMRILGGHYNDNDQLGIGGNEATGIVLDGLDGDPATLDGPELARNHTLHAPLRVRGRGHEVGCRPGHRSATPTSTTTTAGGCGPTSTPTTRSSSTTWSRATWPRGSSIEISRDAVIRNNRVYGNGLRRRRLVLGRRHHGGLQLQRRGLRQPPLRQLQRDHRDPAGPARLDPAGPPARPATTSTTT